MNKLNMFKELSGYISWDDLYTDFWHVYRVSLLLGATFVVYKLVFGARRLRAGRAILAVCRTHTSGVRLKRPWWSLTADTATQKVLRRCKSG